MQTSTEFPVRWEDPADAELTWRFDLAHTPDVMTPLGIDLYFRPFAAGMANGMFYSKMCQQNYYVYSSSPAPPADFDSAPIDPERVMRGVRRWRGEILPEVVGFIDHYRVTDFDAMAPAELVHELAELVGVRRRCGELHFLAQRAYHFGMTHLIETYCELTGGSELSAVRLVQGHGNKSVEAGEALWRLAQLATSVPSVRERLLRVGGAPAKERIEELARDPESKAFVQAFSAYLDEFGWRSNLFELADPTWVEDPTIPLNQLRAYLEMSEYDPMEEQRKLAADREAELRKAVAGLAPEAQTRLQTAVDVAKEAIPILEDHNYYIDQRAAMMPRRLVLAAGRWLVSEGLLAKADDVFYLHDHELRATLLGETGDLLEVAQRRKDEMAFWSKVTPPDYLGAPPEAGPPGQKPDRFTGLRGLRSERRNELKGNAASAGLARGPARVLLSLDDADRLRPGDVLVARTTMPPWTPLFAVASAVVTEIGGILIHAAVVAREYGLPAVLGVKDATREIRDGQLLEVDGTNGIVRIIN